MTSAIPVQRLPTELSSVRFSTKTLAYKAFVAFKCSRLNPFLKYRSIISFSVDWPWTILLLYASESILSVCTIKLQVIVNKDIAPPSPKQQSQNKYEMADKRVLWAKISWLICDPALSVRDNVNHHQGNTCEHLDPPWITVSCHGVEGPMTTGYYCAIFPFCGGGKIKDDKKNKGIQWLGYHRYPSNENQINMLITVSSQDHLIQASKTFPFVQCSLNYRRNSQTIYFPLQPIMTQNPPCKTLATIRIPTSKDPSQELDTKMLTMKLTATKPLLRYNLTNRKHYNPTNLTTLLNSEQCS